MGNCPNCPQNMKTIEDVKVKAKSVEVHYKCRHCTTEWLKTFKDPEIEVK